MPGRAPDERPHFSKTASSGAFETTWVTRPVI